MEPLNAVEREEIMWGRNFWSHLQYCNCDGQCFILFCIFNQEFVRSRVTITQHLAEGSNTANKTGWMTAGLSRNCSSLSPIFQENCCFPCFDYVLLCRRCKALLRLRSKKKLAEQKVKDHFFFRYSSFLFWNFYFIACANQ